MKILMSGESSVINTSHILGVNVITQYSYDQSNVNIFSEMFQRAGFEFTYIPNHDKFGEDVFIAATSYGKGRVVAYASDITVHWATPALVSSPTMKS